MKRVLLCVLLCLSIPAVAKDWYIRDDGGDYNQCTGHTDAPLLGAPVRRVSMIDRLFHRKAVKGAADCALFHPAMLLQPGTDKVWRSDYVGGDTVWFRKNAKGGNGDYPIGLNNPTTGRGIDMLYYGFWYCAGDQYNCTFPSLPSGTKDHLTRWLGPCYPHCSNATGTDVQGAARLIGVNAVYMMVNFEGTEWFDFEGFEVTQYDQCTAAQGTTSGCGPGKDYASRGLNMEYGQGQGPSNGIIRNVSVHGISAQGLIGSHLNRTTADTMIFDHLFLRGNGMAGFDSDGGNCGTGCLNQGRIELIDSLVDFNGCVTPLNVKFDSRGLPDTVNFCSAQSNGGYGDGVVFIAMGDAHVLIRHVKGRYNTQDAFDLLHMGDLQTFRQTLELFDNLAVGNMGQTFKIGGGADTYAINNFANGNCKVMANGTLTLFANYPAGWNNGVKIPGDYCRAGDNWAIFFADGRKTVFIHNTTVGYMPTMYDLLCASTCTGTDTGDFRDNITMGYVYEDNGQLPGVYYFNNLGNPFGNPGSVISHNVYWQVKQTDNCKRVDEETEEVCADPQLAQEEDVDTFDPNMVHKTSPAYSTGITAGLPTDYAGAAWLPTPSRGLLEMTGSGPTPPQPTETHLTLRGAKH
jgi:hypothetical protein